MSTSLQQNEITITPDINGLKIEDVLRSNGILNEVSKVIMKDPGLGGEGFGSQSKYITVEFKDPKIKPLNLFAKVHSSSESHTQMLDEMHAFDKEAKFLTDYVAAAEKMCNEKGVSGPQDLFPKCYYGDNRMIVLENLVLDKGYVLLSKSERQDLDAARFAIQTLAKHHAISYAMIQDEKGAENFFKRFPDLDFEAFDKPFCVDMMGSMVKNALNTNIKILEGNDVKGKDEALSVYNRFKHVSLMGLLIDALKYDDDELLVLNHGDYWNNNMMFLKDKETNRVVGHKAIDFQVTRYNSPALDLGYFMWSSVKTDVRLTYLRELLELYLDVLNKVSSDLGHPTNLAYEKLFLALRKKINFGFWFAMCMVIGPGMEIMKDFDINKNDVKDWPTAIDQLISKWLKENPEYGKTIAEELVKLAKEYQELSLN